jgi:hypothetical protein
MLLVKNTNSGGNDNIMAASVKGNPKPKKAAKKKA